MTIPGCLAWELLAASWEMELVPWRQEHTVSWEMELEPLQQEPGSEADSWVPLELAS